MTSRIIVKNVPKHASEERLREHFASIGEVTDCRVRKTEDGVSRQFAFVGFRNHSEAKAAVKELNRSFFDTSRLSVEIAHAPGSEDIVRPWSKYAAGSSAHAKRNAPKEDWKAAPAQAQLKGCLHKKGGRPDVKKPVSAPPGARSMTTKAVQPTKAGVKGQRTHLAFDSDDEYVNPGAGDVETPETTEPAPREAAGVAFDEELDDLAYLKAKSAKAAADAAGDSEKKTKKKKLKKKKAVEGQDAGPQPDAADNNAAPPSTAELDGGPTAKGLEDNDDLDSGRLYITNVPYGATEDELRAYFEPLGEVNAIHVCKDEDSLKSRGFAYVNYVFPECAVRAIKELDTQAFQGRLMRVAPARAKPPPTETSIGTDAGPSGASSSYKRKQLERKKKVEAHQEHTWNLLYVSANTAADVAAKQLGLSKADLFGKDAEGAAVTAALTETSVIQQTKSWLKKEGIRVDAFEQKGSSMINARAVSVDGATRREDTFIVKHLPVGASAQELRERFTRHGELVKCAMAPSGTVCIVQYAEKAHAKHAFQKIAFSRYRHVPLYLEWAPEDLFDRPPEVDGAAADAKGVETVPGAEEEKDDEPEGARGSLFVKNLNFSTTDAALKAAFSGCKGLRTATIMQKKAAVTKGADAKGLSMGFGFLEFATAEQAVDALKRRQGLVVDGHALNLAISKRGAGTGDSGRSSAVGPKKKGALASPRLCVRNLAFEVKGKELRQLFGAYGSVTAVRIPKKADYSGHRGFAFVDFASKSEAAAAFEALQHTHLYGRRMVIEAAEEKANDVATAALEAQKRQASRSVTSEAKKRQRTGMLDVSGEAGGTFEDAMI